MANYKDCKFYFGDFVVTPQNEIGEVVGIWRRDHTWVYQLKGLRYWAENWWQEQQLQLLREWLKSHKTTELEDYGVSHADEP